MHLLERIDQKNNEQTIYRVKLDDGKIVHAKRLYFPEFYAMRTFRVVLPDMSYTGDISEAAIYRFLRGEVPEDFIFPIFERRICGSIETIADRCCSREQAVYIAEKTWIETNGKSRWAVFRIVDGKKVLRDWLRK